MSSGGGPRGGQGWEQGSGGGGQERQCPLLSLVHYTSKGWQSSNIIYLGDVCAQTAMCPSTLKADEDACVDGSPAGSCSAPAPHTISAVPVFWQLQKLPQLCQLFLVHLHGDTLGLTGIPGVWRPLSDHRRV